MLYFSYNFIIKHYFCYIFQKVKFMKKILIMFLLSISIVLAGCTSSDSTPRLGSREAIERYGTYRVSVTDCNLFTGRITIRATISLNSNFPEANRGARATIGKAVYYGGTYIGSIAVAVRDARPNSSHNNSRTFNLGSQVCGRAVTAT
jgi:hypothetical protein